MEENKEEKSTAEHLEDAYEKALKAVATTGIQTSNIDYLCKLLEMEEKIMRYGEYDNYSNYGRRYEPYGRRGMDRRYRGHDHMDRMYDNYSRYEEGREQYHRGNYGAKEDANKSLEYMLEAMVDFVKMLREDADSPEDMEMIRRYTRKISEM